MRERERIGRITKLIEKIWLKNQDMRLGQLLANYCFGHHIDIWFQEDEKSEQILKEILKEMKQNDILPTI